MSRVRKPRYAFLVALLASLAVGCASAASAGDRTSAVPVAPADQANSLQQRFVSSVRAVSLAVVQVRTSVALGSGVVFDARGDVVTNAHVVDNATRFVVTLASGDSHPATLVGRDAGTDVAVIHVTGARPRSASFANSAQVEVGDLTLAIGNPLGLRSSVTDGIVSAIRQGVSEGNGVALPVMVQTSAAINPGNSGGALADIHGRVIGIPTLAATDPELGGTAAPGIGFAIPSNLVKDIATQLIRHGHVVNSHRGYLGVQIGDTNGAGVLVQGVSAGGPAAKAGLVSGDVITSINDHGTSTIDDLISVLSELKPQQTVTVKVVTQQGAHKTLHLTLGTFPGTG